MSSGAESLKRMLMEMERGARGEPEDPPRPLPEAQVDELRLLYERYRAGCPFTPGEFVTPRRGYGIASVGDPHVVLEVRAGERAHECWAVEGRMRPGNNMWGARFDLRVGLLDRSGEYSAYWIESWAFERWRTN